MKEIIIFLITACAPILIVMELIPESKIFGGQYADENQFPYQISLQRDGNHKCGGVILTKLFVLTVAHCVTDDKLRLKESPNSFTVVAGTISLDEGGRSIQADTFIVHEKYRCCGIDIALIYLKEPFDWNDSIKPIRIYEKELKKNSIVTISGWGYYNEDLTVSIKLKYNNFYVSSTRDCQKQIRSRYSQGLLCLNYPANNGACNGDSGGPAIFEEQLVGVASFVFRPCADPVTPDVYVKVLSYLDWIYEKINEKEN